MNDKITDNERRQIQQAFRDKFGVTWKEIASENSKDGKESYFWIRIDGRDEILKAAQQILDVLDGFVENFGGVEFMVSFLQLTATSIISWDRLVDKEIRSGHFERILGLFPNERRRGDYTVFDRDI